MSFIKKIPALAAMCALSSSLAIAQDSQPTSAPAADNGAETSAQMSTVIGFQIGEQMKIMGLEFDDASFKKGMKLAADGQDFPYSQEEMAEFQMKMEKVAQEAAQKAEKENSAKATAFMEANKSEDGVMTTDSGLQYMVLSEGDGASPTAEDTVTVHYAGTLLDGSEFDSSYSRGEPATFPLGGVIPGWTEGLQLMKTGAKYRFFIPPDLGYGPRGSAPAIPPNSALIFDVELISIAE